jgi:hypothetical protein
MTFLKNPKSDKMFFGRNLKEKNDMLIIAKSKKNDFNGSEVKKYVWEKTKQET